MHRALVLICIYTMPALTMSVYYAMLTSQIYEYVSNAVKIRTLWSAMHSDTLNPATEFLKSSRVMLLARSVGLATIVYTLNRAILISEKRIHFMKSVLNLLSYLALFARPACLLVAFAGRWNELLVVLAGMSLYLLATRKLSSFRRLFFLVVELDAIC